MLAELFNRKSRLDEMYGKYGLNDGLPVQRIEALAPAGCGLMLRALLVLGLIRLGLRLLRFKRLRAILALLNRPVSPPQQISVHLLVGAVTTATHLMPNVKCLAQALAAQTLLRWQGYEAELKLGVAKSGKTLLAHAWVECQGRVVIGRLENSGKRYQLLEIPKDRQLDLPGLGL